MSDVPELTLRNLMIELKSLTDPIEFGIGLGFPEHEMEIIRKDNPLDVSKQKYALFSKISKNYLTMGITWDTIAHCLDEFVSHKDLALQLRKHESCKIEKEIDTERPVDKINAIALHVGLDPQSLDKPCDDDTHLLQISKLLEHWPSYAPYLGLTDQELNGIQRDVTLTGVHMKPHRMLIRWQEKKAYSPEANYRFLLNGCMDIHDNAKLVGDICKLIKK